MTTKAIFAPILFDKLTIYTAALNGIIYVIKKFALG